ncbi:MAG: hypothetical protein OXG81_00675 [Acidobacteria bacterium]|nr:hypothetical protein [Acidobacteriota bacterium]
MRGPSGPLGAEPRSGAAPTKQPPAEWPATFRREAACADHFPS